DQRAGVGVPRHRGGGLGGGDPPDDRDEGGAVTMAGAVLDLNLHLLDRQVIDADGRMVCNVDDLELELDPEGRPYVTAILVGPLLGSMAAPRLDSLLLSRRHTGSTLGYDRREQQGPWLLRAIVRRLHRNLAVVPWSAVADHTGRITLTLPATDLPTHQPG